MCAAVHIGQQVVLRGKLGEEVACVNVHKHHPRLKKWSLIIMGGHNIKKKKIGLKFRNFSTVGDDNA
jgi:hypothetical protein